MSNTCRRQWSSFVFTIVVALIGAEVVPAQESATVTIPLSVSFTVADIGASTSGAPAPTIVAFSNAALLPDHLVRISVRAAASTFGSGTAAFPASLVSWSVAGASGGNGLGGALSDTSWTAVFEGNINSTQGAADLVWILDGPGQVRAGTHTLDLQWKIESVIP